ncbi:hypothetical protein OIU77_026404 [Salix suchowensis]|uniref:Uncharacterized protein n=1 Tax=Salix suchowensis TaxID=1278906 RepID=A0ABQ9BPY3_9ROSI|nr:hypothetical protein OIU77_026404 [Salix suchowensis]
MVEISSPCVCRRRFLNARMLMGILLNTVEELDNIGLHIFSVKLASQFGQLGQFSSPIGATIKLQLHLSDMLELALALEASGRIFIWVVRPPIGFDINMEFEAKEWLPVGFEERIEYSKRGLLVRKWAPQVEILSHKSVSTFLSHCGWNSVLESLVKEEEEET